MEEPAQINSFPKGNLCRRRGAAWASLGLRLWLMFLPKKWSVVRDAPSEVGLGVSGEPVGLCSSLIIGRGQPDVSELNEVREEAD